MIQLLYVLLAVCTLVGLGVVISYVLGVLGLVHFTFKVSREKKVLINQEDYSDLIESSKQKRRLERTNSVLKAQLSQLKQST